ncbi:hypothetical protein [Neptunomonas antarctica]|uniref:Uncharacterized protein n=1 Tax=Neptunomonas antarctica TaxID=619304 RepID=A0A1N7MW30_9GAMM|nr:hypothetical protein [Neptunomonas antarctica]SIS90333.1 hypothetical protein SAMN05421760_10768 [Neptunomonas antarctica]
MHTKFTVQIGSFRKINQIPNAWSNEDYHALMAIMNLDDGLEEMDASELREMCMMSLNDMEPHEAANVVLTRLFSNELPEGKIDQLSHDMPDDRLWEEHSDCLLHERFFSAYALLREAFNGIFAQPTGVQLTLDVTAKSSEDMAIFDESPDSSMVRLLASGLSEDALINRLYEDQIQGEQFPQAPGIVWQLEQIEDNGLTRQFSLVSSFFWFEQLGQLDEFEATSHADVTDEGE